MSYMEKRHPKAKRRHDDIVHQKRKEYIIRYVFQDEKYYQENRKNLHLLNKEKLHCSCPLCSTKTKNRGYSRHDKRLLDSYHSQLETIEG